MWCRVGRRTSDDDTMKTVLTAFDVDTDDVKERIHDLAQSVRDGDVIIDRWEVDRRGDEPDPFDDSPSVVLDYIADPSVKYKRIESHHVTEVEAASTVRVVIRCIDPDITVDFTYQFTNADHATDPITYDR